jgi:hypothetical protein
MGSAGKLPNGLTAKQMAFCREYVRNGGNGTDAYLTAYDGHSTRNTAHTEASLLLDIPTLTQHLQSLVQRQIDAADVDDALVLQNLRRESLRTTDGSTGSSRVRASELMGRVLRMPGLVESRIEISGSIQQQHLGAIADLSLDELRAIVGESKALESGTGESES